MKEPNEAILYSTPKGDKKVEVLFHDENFWLPQKAIAQLFGVEVPAINKHLGNIYETGELKREPTISILETVRPGGRFMKYNPDIHHRRSIRLKRYDYSQTGAYFVSICTHSRACLFGKMVNGEMVLNDAGRMVESVWDGLSVRFGHIELDEFIVMPNHIHGIFVLHRRGEPCVRPVSPDDQTSGEQNPSGEYKIRPYGTMPDTVGRILQAFKSITTHEYTMGVKQHGWPPFPGKLWQRNYYERIIRNEDELNRIREYIINNPKKWEFDWENSDVSILETSVAQWKGQS